MSDHRRLRTRPAVFLRTSSAGRIAVPGNWLGGRRAGHGVICADQRHHRPGTSGSVSAALPAPRQPVVSKAGRPTGAHENDVRPGLGLRPRVMIVTPSLHFFMRLMPHSPHQPPGAH